MPKLTERIVTLALVKHGVGDGFSLELPRPDVLWKTKEMEELLALPGVYTVSMDVGRAPSDGGRHVVEDDLRSRLAGG